jgi:hypothetical protein
VYRTLQPVIDPQVAKSLEITALAGYWMISLADDDVQLI